MGQADGFESRDTGMGGGALFPSSSKAGADGGLAGLLSAGTVAVRGVLCLPSPGPSARGAAGGAVSVGSNEPREALVGCSATSTAASLSTLLNELPSSWGKGCGSWKRLGNLGLI